ncbi:ribonuclease P/MRP 38kDa subunit S homeolog isoform X1 [Xenopus laevis]|uniref:MGC81745 protein n=2 Tax=Xenopus laevis TaxID=8355 RepID=Q641F5_XENLA|nr:ribonuclease P/MRP 38kDa subunit S homeolog [Xenopus laevis]XP_018124231.1 ribonuclease P/MRP 38kDa subunit S homeolog isoform X1 [Xenopus laevis]XP_018124232.1 ribonuclease P/MRP 38kDa subunit S homeolog isoform X1 [Xenopus laevis]XP_018124233.1 ribonuclease P/MRP 38kDa subunit S homeolog isoform X1 [Xenopus laevis]AAH82382.1 MGC81745 protein [Xenopus laevis]OCT73981.1 hypothetical protein XELAEV_18032943mg [Xenopus laevis]
MAAKGAKGSKSKPIIVKTTLNNPYEIAWNTALGEDMQFILKTLTDKFKELGLKKIEMAKKPRKTKQVKTTKGTGSEKAETQKESCEATASKEVEEDQGKSGWTRNDLRKELAIGINEVTRGLEKNELSLVLVCKSAKPEMITKHLIELSISRETPACQIPRLSENIAPALGLKSVLALGFKKNSDVFVEEVKSIIPKIPPLNLPWLNKGLQKAVSSAKDAESMEEASSEPLGSRKRKHMKSEAETTDVSDIKLQALKVKKIVPNPNKIRKIKKKKPVKK